MSQQQLYKCPCCNGSLNFDVTSQKVKCPYCDTEFDVSTLIALDEDLSGDTQDSMNWQDTASYCTEEDGLRIYSCSSCGGEIVGDQNMAATLCPFCSNPVVMKAQFVGDLRPDLVLPFKVGKDAAVAGLKSHLVGKKLLPKVFSSQNHIEEVKGVYIPFWLYDTKADARIRYKATKLRTWSDSNYNYTETSYYSVVRAGNLDFKNVPVDGSERTPNDLMESLEPFDVDSGVDFQTAYLAGFFADRYDVDQETCRARANERIKTTTEKQFAATVVGYNSVNVESSSVNFDGGRSRYALLPVWLLTTTWNKEKYIFAMNGQTGKFVGNLPVDKAARSRMRWTTGLGVGAAVLAAQLLIHLFLL